MTYGSHNSATGNRSPPGLCSTVGDDEGTGNMADGCRVMCVDNVEEATAAVMARSPKDQPTTALTLVDHSCDIGSPKPG